MDGWRGGEKGEAYLRSSRSFCQLGIVRLSQAMPRERMGSPKKRKPARKEVDLMKM